MNKLESFNDFLTTQSVEVEILIFVASLVLAMVMSLILARIYVKYGVSLSNRRSFARNFVLLSMTTMVIITIVKSSLALSLGLVGALSIVRFRAAIKEPEELAYLFLAIAIGLGCGANQWKVTLAGFVLITATILLTRILQKSVSKENLQLLISSKGDNRISLTKINETVKSHFEEVNLRRFDETADMTEVSFTIETDGFDQVEKTTDELRQLDKEIQVTFMDSRGLG